VHDVEVEVVDGPVLELFLADGCDARVVVEGVQSLETRKRSERLTRPSLMARGDALAGFDFVAVV
jgi:hypothetical protein